MAAPGTAELYEVTQRITSEILADAQRRRAMLLNWVDEAERHLGYGQPGKPPRTSQIRQYWRDNGEPDLAG